MHMHMHMHMHLSVSLSLYIYIYVYIYIYIYIDIIPDGQEYKKKLELLQKMSVEDSLQPTVLPMSAK
jgi:hypothetical protein